MLSKMDEVLDKMNREGRATPTAEERQILAVKIAKKNDFTSLFWAD